MPNANVPRVDDINTDKLPDGWTVEKRYDESIIVIGTQGEVRIQYDSRDNADQNYTVHPSAKTPEQAAHTQSIERGPARKDELSRAIEVAYDYANLLYDENYVLNNL